ncbi:MAG: GyrI-like domain-containing protein [Gemmatimonadaceae bacterium]
MEYSISTQSILPRQLAAFHAVMPMRDVPSRFAELLGKVYATARASHLTLDGQNVFIYRDRADGNADVDFGVGVSAYFPPIGEIACVDTPSGEVATTTHWGDYGQLGAAHSAIIDWCQSAGKRLAGPRWEVYGHWHDDPAQVRTDIYYLLKTS